MFMKIINTGSQPGNCYALKSESGEILLLDCGCKYPEILKGICYRISDVSGCLLTHEQVKEITENRLKKSLMQESRFTPTMRQKNI